MVREPARRRVSPGADTRRRSRAHDASGARHRSADARRLSRRRASRAGCAAACSSTKASDAVIKTSGAKGLHIFVPIDSSVSIDAAAAATRAIAARAERLDPDTLTTAFVKDDRGGKVFVDSTRVGGATVVAAYSPRVRPGAPVSFPVDWDELDDVSPADFTMLTAVRQPRRRRPVGGPDAAATAAQRRAARRGQGHPGRSSPGDARGQAPGARTRDSGTKGVDVLAQRTVGISAHESAGQLASKRCRLSRHPREPGVWPLAQPCCIWRFGSLR